MPIVVPLTSYPPPPTITGETCITFQVVDPSDAVLFDLDDPTGVANPYGLKTHLSPVDIGVLPTALSTLPHGGGLAGASLSRRDRQLRTVAWTLAHTGTENNTPEELRDAMNELARLLDLGSQTGNRIKIRPEASMSDRYIRWLGTDEATPLLRGQPDATVVTYEVRDAKFNSFTPMRIVAQPLIERDNIVTEPQVVSMDPAVAGGRVALIDNPGSAPARVNMVVEGPATDEALAFRRLTYGLHSSLKGTVTEYAETGKFVQVEDATFLSGTGTSLVTDAGASPSGGANNAIRDDFTTFPEDLFPRWSVPIDTEPLRGGRYRAFLRAYGDAALTGRMQLGWLSQLSEVLDYSLTVTSRDLDLGVITVPKDPRVSTMLLTLYASRLTGAGKLFSDFITFLPIDEWVFRAVRPSDVDLGYAYALDAPGMGHSPAAAILDGTGNIVSTSFSELIGSPGLWVPPGESALYIQANDDDFLGHPDQALLGRSVTVTFDVTPHDLLT